jgi:hypothetical protein
MPALKGANDMMNIKADQWVWAIFYGEEGNERMLGQQDTAADIAFIPCFLTKDEAINALGLLSKTPGQIYSAQAILYEDIVRYAKENGFMIFFLKANGEVIEKVAPLST